MPSSITHLLVAQQAAIDFPPNMRRAAERHPDYFFWGAQGPDVFFFYRPLSKKEYNLGKFMHRNLVYETFRFFANYLRGETDDGERERELAYTAGYLTHYAADITFHPFVYRLLEENPAKGFVHQQIENDWDVYFLRRSAGREAERFPFPFSPKKIVREETLFRLYVALCQFYGKRAVTKKKFASCIRSFAKYLRFFHGKCYSKQRGWERTERFFHAKPRLSCLYPRKEPAPEYLAGDEFFRLSGRRGGNAEELFRLAKETAARLAQIFAGALVDGELPRAEFNRSFLTAEEVPAAS